MFTKGRRNKGWIGIAALLLIAMIATACGGKSNSSVETAGAPANGAEASGTPAGNAPAQSGEAKLSGQVELDGSSTVYPIMEAVAEEFGKVHKDVKIAVGVSGTGGGFKRFCAGETAISNASRTIKAEEAETCQAAGVGYTEYQIAYDGLSVIVNKDNDFIDYLTVEELALIFGSEGAARTWQDVRADWPAEKILIFSPGADSGTFDYFNEVVLDKKGLRTDDVVTLSEDDNTLVQGIAGSKYGIGYFGFAYYEENADRLKLVPIDSGNGPVAPSIETIKDGAYSPLSRPLYIYTSNKEYERPEVKAFVAFVLDNVPSLAAEVGYIPLSDEGYAAEKAKL